MVVAFALEDVGFGRVCAALSSHWVQGVIPVTGAPTSCRTTT